MKYTLFILVIAICSCSSINETNLTETQIKKDTEAIKAVLHQQAKDWSDASIEAFMEGYQKTPDLLFVGKSGITKGWQETMKRYKSSYPTKDHTGQLTFDVLEVQPIHTQAYLLVGEFHLKRKVGNANGIFTLVFKQIDNQWKVISDHTSAYDD
ncbi:MAG: nuclear transport factor 2 family protein [Flavobacteriaceae bacterium]|nr:nuclear transport factor 2 family protein [Bacteroidia bacterium]NND10152.1 nuclear transport factor 2 family protein [Flavobacteriaceae bacterium]NNL61997.1 nuclear transport factor 2 family protein [Flavobacteriaceae bacterium]